MHYSLCHLRQKAKGRNDVHMDINIQEVTCNLTKEPADNHNTEAYITQGKIVEII